MTVADEFTAIADEVLAITTELCDVMERHPNVVALRFGTINFLAMQLALIARQRPEDGPAELEWAVEKLRVSTAEKVEELGARDAAKEIKGVLK